MTKILSLALVMLMSSACIKTADQVNRERRYDEQIRDSQGLVADMTAQVKELRGQIDRLNGRLEEIEHRQGQVNPENLKKMDESLNLIKSQQESEASQLLQIQNELKEQRTFIEKVTASISEMKTAPAPAKSSKKKSAKDELESGLENIKDNKYSEARADLEPLIDHKDLTPGEQNKVIHGLGKIEYYTGNSEKALVYFSKVFAKFPKSSMAPSSLLFIGRSLKKMGKKDEAKEAFSKVVEDYPKSKEAADARKEL